MDAGIQSLRHQLRDAYVDSKLASRKIQRRAGHARGFCWGWDGIRFEPLAGILARREKERQIPSASQQDLNTAVDVLLGTQPLYVRARLAGAPRVRVFLA